MTTRLKTSAEIAAMREAGRMLATVLEVLTNKVSPGISTQALADIAAKELKDLGGEPSFLGYQGFPSVLCVSLNEEVVHGIPSRERIIKSGDIVSLDFGVTYRGMVTDSAVSKIAGSPLKPAHTQLLKTTKIALEAGINAASDGARTGDIGAAVEAVLSKKGYGIVRDLVGHGVGHGLHEDPSIPNYGRANTGPWLNAGMTIAIEPMATLGTDRVGVGPSGWEVVTEDKSWAAHFEHTVLITEQGAEILTQL